MKKWSISLIVVSALAIAAFALPATSSAAGCPTGFEGTPPYCTPVTPPPPPPPPVCMPGQVGTYPNCVTPALELTKIKVTKQHATVTALVNAPGTLAIYGKGMKTKEVTAASAGSYNLAVALTKGSKNKLKNKGKLKISATVSYAATGAGVIQKTVKLVFKQKKKQNANK
jgi:hypothetical protein